MLNLDCQDNKSEDRPRGARGAVPEGSYDCVIVGGSFAGLAVATQLVKWNVLIIDEKLIGKEIKSTCATSLSLVKKLDLLDTVMQIHKKFVFHTEHGDFTYNLEDNPYCLIDEEKFNQELFERSRAKFLEARVISREKNIVLTDKGNFNAKILVDASGPVSILTSNGDIGKKEHLFFGIETKVSYKGEGLHYYYLPKTFSDGVFWIFPQGDTSRIGIGSYRAQEHLQGVLKNFLEENSLKMNSLHGGFGTHQLRKGVVNNIFVVGDAAGQCLPASAEGIRPAIFFGEKCGQIINNILEGRITLEQGLKTYEKFVESKKYYYKLLDLVQEFYIKVPFWILNPILWISTRRIGKFFIDDYFNIFLLSKRNETFQKIMAGNISEREILLP